MNQSNARVTTPDRRDLLLALSIAVLALMVYTRVLAPDVLYSDSGEFQTLAYTWGMTHTTGYPVYLVLARLVGFIPVNTLAWRINFASAVAAAMTLGGVYLITRRFTGRGGAALASLVLLISYTFWSQSILAEVYTPATALIVTVLLMLLGWHAQPSRRRWLLFLAGFLLGLGLGVHLFMMLIAPSVYLFVLWGIVKGPLEERGRWQHLARLMLGTAAGIVAFYLLFVFIDTRPTPTNIFTTSVYPSRDAWNLQDSDLDTEPERFWINVSGNQWRDRMLPGDVDYLWIFMSFFREDLAREYTIPTLLLAILGALAALVQRRRLCALIGLALVTALAAGLLYFPGDKYIFYLPVYLLLAVFAGAGAGFLISAAARVLPPTVLRAVPAAIMTVVLVAVCAASLINTRWQAIQAGRSVFIKEDYAYPVNRPGEPRRVAECAVSKVAESEAYLVLDWRALYAIYYVAHVEQGRTGLVIRESMPYPTHELTGDLRAEIAEQLRKGSVVYVDRAYPPLGAIYTLTRVGGPCSDYELLRVSLRD